MKRRDILLGSGALAGMSMVSGTVAAAPPGGADDPLGVRADFPVTRDRVFLNTAYLGAVPLPVAEAGIAFDRSKAYDPMTLPQMMEGVESVRSNFARLIGASADEIGFLFSTSEGENIVANALDLKPGDNVVTDELHYTTTYVLYRHLEKTRGIELRIVPTREGRALVEDFARVTDERTRLITVSLVSHENGYRHALKPLADLAHAHGAYLYADAVQAVGMFPIDVKADDVDFLTSGSYKWLHAGFNAAGFYVRDSLLDEIEPDRVGYLHVRERPGEFQFDEPTTARKYEYASPAFNGLYQLDRAIDYLNAVGIDRIESHIVPLANYLNQELRGLGFDVLTPLSTATGIVTFAHGRNPEDVQSALDSRRIVVKNVRETGRVRVSVGLHNNRMEVDQLIEVLRALA